MEPNIKYFCCTFELAFLLSDVKVINKKKIKLLVGFIPLYEKKGHLIYYLHYFPYSPYY